jgi:hypothetical protein
MAGWEGLERATGRMLATGMGIAQLQQQRDYQNARLKQEQAQIQMQMDEKRKMREVYETPVDIKTHPIFLSLPEEQKAEALKFFTSNKFTDERGIGQMGKIMEGAKLIVDTEPLYKKFMGSKVEQQYGLVQEAWKNLSEAKMTGNQNAIQKAQLQFDTISGEYTNARGFYERHIESLRKRAEAERFPYASAGGGVIYDERTGRPVYVKPFKESVSGEKPEKEPSGADMERLRKAVQDVGNDPKPNDVTMINRLARPLGLEYKKTETEEKGRFFDSKKVSWDLVPTSSTKKAYKSAEEVRSAYQNGDITKEEAKKIIKKNRWM